MQYAKCFSGISYTGFRREGWSDNAKGWLDASRTMGCKLGKELKTLIEEEAKLDQEQHLDTHHGTNEILMVVTFNHPQSFR